MKELRASIDRAWSERANGNSELAESLLLQAATTVRESSDIELKVTILRRLGHVFLDRDATADALVVFSEALDLARDSEDMSLYAHMLRHLGDAYRSAGQMKRATAYYHDALHCYRSIDSPPTLDLANAIQRSASALEFQNEHDKAIELWEEARDLYASLNLSMGVQEADEHIAALSNRSS